MNSRQEGIMILDLSNPRAVEERVASISKIKLVNMDQIVEIVEKNIRSRRNEVHSAERIIENEMRCVDSIFKRKKAEPVVTSIFKSVEVIREREFKKALSILGDKLGPKEFRVIEQFSHAIVEGVLSVPMNNLKKEIELNNQKHEDLIKMAATSYSNMKTNNINYHRDSIVGFPTIRLRRLRKKAAIRDLVKKSDYLSRTLYVQYLYKKE